MRFAAFCITTLNVVVVWMLCEMKYLSLLDIIIHNLQIEQIIKTLWTTT